MILTIINNICGLFVAMYSRTRIENPGRYSSETQLVVGYVSKMRARVAADARVTSDALHV